MEFIKIGNVNNQGDIAIIKSLLESNNINFYITNENFSSLYGAASGLTSMDIFVSEKETEQAKDLLNNFV